MINKNLGPIVCLPILLLFILLTLMSSCNTIITQPGTGQTSVTGWLTTSDRSSLLRQTNGFAFSPYTTGGDQVIMVDDQVQYQQMDGFGASLTESAAYVLCSNLSSFERDAVMLKLFDRTQGIGLSILRQPIGASDFALSTYSYDDMPSGFTDTNLTNFSISRDSNGIIQLLKQAMTLNPELKIIASPWSPPGWMRSGDSMVQGGSLNLSAYASYANYFVKYIQAYASIGIPVYAVTVQNESEFEPLSNAGMIMTAAEEANFVKNDLGPAFLSNSISTKIICYDHNWDNTNHALTVLGDAAARNYISGSAWHVYGGVPDAMTKVYNAFSSYGKGVWFTEGGSGTWVGTGTNKGTWRTCFLDQLHFMIQITRNWSKTVIWWNLALDQNGGPMVYTNTNNYAMVRVNNISRTVETPYMPNYYSMGHLSKFVRPNAWRVDSTTDTNQMESVAFKNADGTIVLLAVNPWNIARTARIVWKGTSFLFTMPAESAVTFSWPGN